ncbi:MAG TPA: ribosomal RNA small subunit methyltransferase A [candidate division WOR-3 bacterium]|uniref:Ribosomal RNA small subunit methyltransferase A n=1 Tax=candidate division WOR-3 bacterium TaxID=2052148 RepID=A0A7V0T799_UNCW3|nr:ribosomal RNA small subunit methyltransferase A [candidate division WOR-3 bacterium]
MRRFSPHKALGQSFLVHAPTAEALVNALEPGGDDTVLEIGPGRGALTRLLVGRAGRVVAVELDPRLADRLLAELGAEPGFRLIIADFLTWRPDFERPVKVIGNLPYSVSSPMLFRLLDDFTGWTTAVLTTQREFARRVLGGPGSKDYSAMSVFCERWCRREKLLSIPGRYFRPRPDVVSTSFRLVRRERPLFPVEDEAFFRRLVRAAFAQRRKTLANNIVAGFGVTRAVAEAALAQAGIDAGCRAEAVPAERFSALAGVLGRV